MKTRFLALALTLTAFSAAAQDHPGFTTLTVPATTSAPPIDTAVWYPGTDGKLFQIGNAVFKGVSVLQDASVTGGKHPVVLLSHGMGGNYRSLGWLAAALAERGAIVISVNHPHSTTGDLNMKQAFDHWTRKEDLERALAFVEADPRFASAVDTDRLYAAGFSFGGWTVLSMAGVRGNIRGFADYCDNHGESTHCRDISRWGVDMHALNADTWDASYKMPTLKAVAAIDPAFTFGIDAQRVADVSAKVLLVGLGSGSDRLAATDFSEAGSNFGATFAAAAKLNIAPATHFTAMFTCNPNGAAILADEKDDPVCTDPPGTDREAVHQKIIEATAQLFGLDTKAPSN